MQTSETVAVTTSRPIPVLKRKSIKSSIQPSTSSQLDCKRAKKVATTLKTTPPTNALSAASNERRHQHTTSPTFQPKTINHGREYIVGETRFMACEKNKEIYITEMLDYTIISDANFSKNELELLPRYLKPLLDSRWYYSIHVATGCEPIIDRDVLRARVTGGEITAYKYTNCSIHKNNCIYYGFLPTLVQNVDVRSLEGGHRICRVGMLSVWPRKLYVHLKREFICNCSENCWYWSVRLENYYNQQRYCFKNIPWKRLYIIMGEEDVTCIDSIKVARTCPVCAQCFACSNSVKFCRRHRECKHKQAVFFEPNDGKTLISDSKIKSCTRLKLAN